MRFVLSLYSIAHGLIAVLFAAVALLLVMAAGRMGWDAAAQGLDGQAALGLIETLGLLAVAVVALQISQTIAEEEVVRDAHVSGPTRVRRFLSRFMVVVTVALAIEGLIAVFKALREDPARLPHAAVVLLAVAALMVGWGVFIKLNRAAEELEPEAMQEAKSEDVKLR